MINVIIYLEKSYDAKDIVKSLLVEKVIASASIDIDNTAYRIVDGDFSEVVHNVITAQSKALLFKRIITIVEGKTNKNVMIFSTPIIGSNEIFEELVKQHTVPT